MYDFLRVKKEFQPRYQKYVYTPTFVVKSNVKDLMIRSRDFYALYNENTGMWEQNEATAIELIDNQILEFVKKDAGDALMNDEEHRPVINFIYDTDNRVIDKFHKFVQKDMKDSYETLNQSVKFSNSEIGRKDYSTYRLDYPLVAVETPYYNKLVDTLYLPEEKEKFEWAVGCILAGDQSKIHKLFVFYGQPGSGKSTIINKVITNSIFGGSRSPYCSKFTAGLLANKDSFGTDFLTTDPLIAFDDDADLSRIEDNTTLNVIISHEAIRVNGKFQRTFTAYPNCFLICGTNETVALSPNSGLNRRLIDIRQTGEKLMPDEYDECISHLEFEKSGIANHCLEVYKKRGKNYYNHYQPEDMLTMTSPMHNFVKDNYLELKDGITLANAYTIYCTYAEDCKFKTVMTRYKFRDQLKLYFFEYNDYIDGNGKVFKNYFSGFISEKIGIRAVEKVPEEVIEDKKNWLSFDCTTSIFDELYSDSPAQYANEEGTPKNKWDNVKTVLAELDTSKLHYVRIQPQHIIIDFDIKNSSGEKDLALNMAEASKFPPTYAELSKSGTGIHLHYIYTGGDPEELSRIYSPNVEVKVYSGNSSLRRKLTLCNNLLIATISSGLPKKEGDTKMVNWDGLKNEKMLRVMIAKNLLKEYHHYTKPSIDYIEKLLSDAYASGMTYDVRDMKQDIYIFAMSSSNNADYCVDRVSYMKFCSGEEEVENYKDDDSTPIIFLDVEISPSSRQVKNCIWPGEHEALFLVTYKFAGGSTCLNMFNPTPAEVENLFKYRIIGFNNRNYDNHMLWARAQGYTSEELYNLSCKIINKDKQSSMNSKFAQAYGISYTDIFDYASSQNKQGLKKWEIQLGLPHMEWRYPWDQPVPKEKWIEFGEYCSNDVKSTEVVHNYLIDDWEARQFLAQMSGLTVNHTTNQHTIEILTHGIKDPQKDYVYTNLGEMTDEDGNLLFPGYEFDIMGIDKTRYKEGVKIVSGKSIYRGEDPGEGGHKIANPGEYNRVPIKDIASMHPHSAIRLGLFGPVITKRYQNLVEARVAIKHIRAIGDQAYLDAISLMDAIKSGCGSIVKTTLEGLEGKDLKKKCKAIANALKTAINSVYGLTSAHFDNKLRDPRNVDNIVAKYGALFMINLKHEVANRGFKVVHVSVDSIKIADATPDILNFIDEYGAKYGYTFEHEATYSKMCIVNDAVYIAKYETPEKCEEMYGYIPEDNADHGGEWTATGTQFKIPYVFKTLFSHEEVGLKDMRETKSVKEGSINKEYSDGSHVFVGRVGEFTPVTDAYPGRSKLVCIRPDGRIGAVSGTKDYYWADSAVISDINLVDLTYYRKLCDAAVSTIGKFVDFNDFVTVDYPVGCGFVDVNPDYDEEEELLPWTN